MDAGEADARTDATAVPRCEEATPFGAPAIVPGLASGRWFSPRLSDDELTLYLAGSESGGAVPDDLWVASRASRRSSFGAPVKLAISSSSSDLFPTVSGDGRTIVFDSDRGGARRLWVATRASSLGEFANPEPLAGVGATGTQDADVDPFLTADGQELWFASTRSPGQGNIDLWRATRSGAGFANPVPEPNLSSSTSDGIPVLSHDRLTIYFQSSRTATGTLGDFDIWRSRRSTLHDGFPVPTPVMELNSTAADWPGWLSPDGCRLYLASNRTGMFAIYLAERQPSP